ncbi:hypothetical protein F5883DRAFT_596203 [Diaporthe sp. PMI_573]|nr:hypothetical protein F5883DRAFT_596203 [Diaporthaceae sp. PMI_573]
MGEVHIFLGSVPDGSNLYPWFLQARSNERSVLKLFDPSTGLNLHARDEYRINNTPPLQPLSPDRVLENRHITSSGAGSRLLTTPVEILVNILKYIAEDKKALASLAFVNSDCRQLARSYQFKTICLDYSPNTLELLIRLVKEGQERDINHGATPALSIGACIRRVRVKTDTHWIQEVSDLWVSRQDFKDLPAVEKDKRLEDANQAYFDVYIPDIGFVLRKSLPNLEYLAWEDPVLLDRPFFNSLVHSSVKQLKLCKVRVLEDFEVEIPPSGAWPLQSLDIEMELAQRGQCPTADANSGEQHSLVDPRDGQSFERKDLHDTRPASQEMEVNFFRLSTSILRLCAPTLEALKWCLPHDRLKPIPFDPELLEFPRLRILNLGSRMKLEKRLAKALISSHLSGLTINTQTDPVISQRLDEIGYMQSLEKFEWNSWMLQETQPLDFLSRNTHLTGFTVGLPASPGFLDNRVVPLLASSFCRLKSLDLCWGGTSIPESSIIAISAIASLEHLKLDATDPAHLEYWPINHVLMRTHLCRLRNLKKLAFYNDTYTPRNPALTEEDYYAIRRPQNGDYEVAQCRLDVDGDSLRAAIRSLPDSVVWELSHRNRMLTEAEKYAAIMPSLEWVYFGQIPMGFKLQSDRIRAIPLWPRRDDCITALSEIFGHLAI